MTTWIRARESRRTAVLATVLMLVLAAATPAPTVAQSQAEAVMIAAGQWAKQQLPSGTLRLDPHRSGQSSNADVAQRVAGALGAQVATLDESRSCTDVMDPSTCTLASTALLAISEPSISGNTARTRVYAWYRQDSPREPIAKRSWDLTLEQQGNRWVVVERQRIE